MKRIKTETDHPKEKDAETERKVMAANQRGVRKRSQGESLS